MPCVVRFGGSLVGKRRGAKRRAGLNPMVLLDYRCYVPGGKIGTNYPPRLQQVWDKGWEEALLPGVAATCATASRPLSHTLDGHSLCLAHPRCTSLIPHAYHAVTSCSLLGKPGCYAEHSTPPHALPSPLLLQCLTKFTSMTPQAIMDMYGFPLLRNAESLHTRAKGRYSEDAIGINWRHDTGLHCQVFRFLG